MSLSFFFDDFWVIFVTNFSKRLPGGYWFLVVGSVITGLLGGMNFKLNFASLHSLVRGHLQAARVEYRAQSMRT